MHAIPLPYFLPLSLLEKFVCLDMHLTCFFLPTTLQKPSQCVENLESILRSDKAVVYWLRSGCMHLDREGPEIVKPCPAHAICAWVPNLFADVGIISPRNSLAPLCPRDFKYLPRIPRKPATATAL